MTLRYASLCAGYGGLDMGVMSVLGGELAWYSEFDDAPARVAAAHYPGIPNFGDLTLIDWATVPPIEVLTAGFPCQPFSLAGKRLGANDERHLWPHIAQAVAVLRPRLVVLENVRGLLSGQGEPDPEHIATLDEQAHRWSRVVKTVIKPKIRKAHRRGQLDRIVRLEADAVRLLEQRRLAMDTVRRARARLVRAIGVVARDLANIGYDARWYGLRAADVGAAHGRFRIFLFAVPADAAGDPSWLGIGDRGAVADPGGIGRERRPSLGRNGRQAPELTLLPTPKATSNENRSSVGWGSLNLGEAIALLPNQRGSSGDLMLPSAVHLLPTPTCNDMGEGKTHGNGNGHGASLAIEAQRADRWGQYAPAIARWEAILGRPAPAPTETMKGAQRLSPRLVEWMMGLSEGWVTDRGLSRTDQLKCLGNGVVPQQAAAATWAWVCDMRAEVAA